MNMAKDVVDYQNTQQEGTLGAVLDRISSPVAGLCLLPACMVLLHFNKGSAHARYCSSEGAVVPWFMKHTLFMRVLLWEKRPIVQRQRPTNM